jgi:hypothetical protein
LVFINFGPSEVVEGVLGREPDIVSQVLKAARSPERHLPLGRDDAVWRQFEDI